MWTLLLACQAPAAPLAAPSPASPSSSSSPSSSPASPEPPVPFTCDSAPLALGFPGASCTFCKEATVLRGLFRVRLEGTPGRLDRVVVVTDGTVSAATGTAAFARFLRASALWSQERVAAEELRDALDAFDARPPGFDRQSGPATVDDRGKPVFLSPAALSVRLETSRATWDRARGQGVSRTPSTVRATLTGGAATSLTWQVEAQQGSSWVVVETLPLEP